MDTDGAPFLAGAASFVVRGRTIFFGFRSRCSLTAANGTNAITIARNGSNALTVAAFNTSTGNAAHDSSVLIADDGDTIEVLNYADLSTGHHAVSMVMDYVVAD